MPIGVFMKAVNYRANIPSFLSGVARLMDFSGAIPIVKKRSTRDSIRGDWAKVGGDLKASMVKYKYERK